MKIALAQLNYTIGDFDGNTAKIIENINRAKAESADLVVFAELSICGTPAYSLLEKVTFLEHCEEALVQIASCCDGISALVGLPIQREDGATVSAMALIQNRKVMRYVTKEFIRIGDDRPFMFGGTGVQYIKLCGKKIAIVVGEDIYKAQEYGHNADLIINTRSSQYRRGIVEKRHNDYRAMAFRYNKPIVMVNQVGAQTDVVFDGSSAFYDAQGHLVSMLNSFGEDFKVIDTEASLPEIDFVEQNRTENFYKAIILGLRDYFAKNDFKKAGVGMSGGIDSAVVGALAVEALGAENVYFLMMPSQFTPDESVDDAIEMGKRLNVEYNVIPINESYKAMTESLIPVCGGTPFDVTEEKIQSRLRGTMLMAMANKKHCTILNTTNKSEFATGYGTLYGDYIGDFSILADVYKCEVYSLARYINRNQEIIPMSILEKEPSAELHPGQKDSDYLPPYDITDAILYRMIEQGQHREEIINSGFDDDVVRHIHSRLVKAASKRHQFCPILRLSTKPLRPGVEIPITTRYGLYY
ncbi:MAG: NAD+ synthase [Rikenellaceae bacterium]|nr:NAD+ synthase [Rikenellaceae bacterium]